MYNLFLFFLLKKKFLEDEVNQELLPPLSAGKIISPSYVLGSKLVTASRPLHFIAALS